MFIILIKSCLRIFFYKFTNLVNQNRTISLFACYIPFTHWFFYPFHIIPKYISLEKESHFIQVSPKTDDHFSR